MKNLSYILIVACILAPESVPGADESKRAVDSPVSAVNSIIDIVLDRHIDPPTRQEMLLAGMRAAYRKAGKPLPRGLSRRISEIATPDQIDTFLSEELAGIGGGKAVEASLVVGLLDCVRGGASLTDASMSRVNSQVAANRYVGTGIALGIDGASKQPVISKVFYNGPAWKAGAKARDLILEIDGAGTGAMQMNDVLQALRGDAGSIVRMLVSQPDAEEKREIVVTRDRVFLPSVEGHRLVSEGQWRYTIDDAPDVALLRLTGVGPSTLHELRQVERTLQQQGVRGIVLDLRMGGALLHDVVMVADALIDDAVIGHIQSLDGRKTHVARAGAMFSGMPMVVLTSRFTSAGQVFLTSALQDSGRAVVVGERTSGNMYVRSLIDVPGRDEQITLATAVMHRADGTPLLTQNGSQSSGPLLEIEKAAMLRKKRTRFIMPDHEVSGGKGVPGRLQKKDEVLSTAIAVIREKIKGEASEDSVSVENTPVSE